MKSFSPFLTKWVVSFENAPSAESDQVLCCRLKESFYNMKIILANIKLPNQTEWVCRLIETVAIRICPENFPYLLHGSNVIERCRAKMDLCTFANRMR